MTAPNREPLEIRNQIVLDLSNPKVRDVIFDMMEKIISESGAEYVKWDCNRGIFDLIGAEELFYRHTVAVYDLLGRITERFPNVLFESCASGGNRFDLGMLCFSPQIWTSDNTDPRVRIAIQEGTLCAYPQASMGSHVAQSPSHHTFNRTSLESRFAVSAVGAFGYEFDLTKLSEKEVGVVKEHIEFYKKWRDVLQFGDYFRTSSSFESDYASWTVVSKDKSRAVATAASLGHFDLSVPPRVRIAGLDPDSTYKVNIKHTEFANDVPEFTARGDALCGGGIWLGRIFTEKELTENSNSIASRMITFEKIK